MLARRVRLRQALGTRGARVLSVRGVMSRHADPRDLRAAFARCEAITRREARNFWYGIRLLPREKRLALAVVYAWMRVADDIVDAPDADARSCADALDALEVETRAAFVRAPIVAPNATRAAIARALSAVAHRFPIRLEDFLGAIQGQRTDLARADFVDEAAVDAYCDCVASTVGRICVGIWGVVEPAKRAEALRLATLRGLALQRTNMLRDLAEDAAQGRCYFSSALLASHGVTRESFLRDFRNRPAQECVMSAVETARMSFVASDPLEALLMPDSRAASLVMSCIYREVLERIAADPRRAMRGRRVSLSFARKLWIVLSILVRTARGATR